jgi:hypothetical protein
MIHLTQAQYDELVRTRDNYQTLLRLISDSDVAHGASITARAQALVQLAERVGKVLTIEQRPLQPLAMGHYETVVSVRQARERASA